MANILISQLIRNYQEILALLNAAERGDTDALLKLALMHQHGDEGVPKSSERTRHFYEMGAKLGDIVAQQELKRLDAT